MTGAGVGGVPSGRSVAGGRWPPQHGRAVHLHGRVVHLHGRAVHLGVDLVVYSFTGVGGRS